MLYRVYKLAVASRKEVHLAPRHPGVFVAWWRERAGMTRTELARRLGLKDSSAVGHYEKFRSEPSFEMLARMAVILGARTLSRFFAARIPRGWTPRTRVWPRKAG